MKNKNVFISHKGEDDEHIQKLKSLLESKGYNLKNSSIDSSKPNDAHSEEYIKSILRPRIEWAGTLICLIGDKTAQSKWVNWEIEYATKEGKNIVGVFLHGATDSEIPDNLNVFADSIVAWNGKKIINAIENKGNFENSDGSPRDNPDLIQQGITC
ncbi:MAG: TIR domain-containing protein [Bacteroidia bacterium]|jgi:hypothetical protein|nr:TIR domain-containing protein [Bacteroidia bacterium]